MPRRRGRKNPVKSVQPTQSNVLGGDLGQPRAAARQGRRAVRAARRCAKKTSGRRVRELPRGECSIRELVPGEEVPRGDRRAPRHLDACAGAEPLPSRVYARGSVFRPVSDPVRRDRHRFHPSFQVSPVFCRAESFGSRADGRQPGPRHRKRTRPCLFLGPRNREMPKAPDEAPPEHEARISRV